jgi:predicted DNA-binding transcriptional regulator YafY
MERTRTQFARLMELDRLIRAGRHPNCLTFAADWEVSQKTVQRDIDFMRDQLGAPIEYDRVRKGYFYSDPSWFLPSLSLSEGDLLALLIGSRALESYRGTPVAEDLERVFRKLAGMLPESISLRPELLFSRFSFTSPPSKPVDEAVWTAVVRGVLHRRSLKISYRPFEANEAREREIHPYHIANLAGEWYVFARSGDAGVLQFAVPRILRAKVLKRTFEVPEDFDAEKLVSSAFGRFTSGKVHRVRVMFDAEVAPWVLERQWSPTQTVRRKRDGSVELSFEAAGLFEVFRWVLAWGRHATVLAPKELKEWVADEAKAMAEKAGKAKTSK